MHKFPDRRTSVDLRMEHLGASNRTRALLYIFRIVAVIGVGLVTALILSLAGYFVLGWEHAPVPQLGVLVVYAAIAVVTLRLGLRWSLKLDRRD